jgi:ribonucleoside-diphosphate reductase alpha chain
VAEAPKVTAPVAEKVADSLIGVPVMMKPRPEVLSGKTYKSITPFGNAYVSVNEDDDGNIFEVFINVGKAGSDISADAVAIGRLISMTFRIPSPFSSDRIAQNVVDQLAGIGGSSSAGFGQQRVRSLADAVAKVLREHESGKAPRLAAVQKVQAELPIAVAEAPVASGTPAESPAAVTETVKLPTASTVPAPSKLADMCPDCGNASLRFIEGCQKCEICGFSKC